MSDAGQLRGTLRAALKPLQSTPFHPKWLVTRQNRGRTSWVARRAEGAVLDVGCAGSAISAALDRSTSYCGLDYPTTATGLYRTRPDVFGDACHLPFADESFDTILFLDVLEHVSEPEAALAEARRVLRVDGRLLITIPFAYPLHDQPHDYQRFTEHGLAFRIRRSGLVNASMQEVGNATEAACGNLAMALAQGAIDAIAERNWRRIFLPTVPPIVLMINLLGWLFARLLPTRQMMPGAYYVEARRA